MKGGFNNPPNAAGNETIHGCHDASMKGGFNNPPNDGANNIEGLASGASMKGGFNNPPNTKTCGEKVPVMKLQ